MAKEKSFAKSFVTQLVEQHIAGTLSMLKRSDGRGPADDLAEAERISRFFNDERQKIERDPRLTQAGRVDALRAAGKKALGELEKWSGPLREVLDRHESQLILELRGAIAPAPPKDTGERIEASLLRSEIRRAVSSMNEQELELLYRQGDHVVRDALGEVKRIQVKNGAVRVREYVSAEVREEVLIEAGRQALPEKADLLDDLREVRGAFDSVAVAIRGEIKKVAPSAVPEPAPRIVA